MNKQFGNEDPRLEAYVKDVYRPEDEVLREIRERTVTSGLPDIQVAALDARHLEVLTRMVGAKKAVEVGTLGGYSGVAILRGMGDGGRLWTCELEAKNAEVARESFRKAGFSDGSFRIVVGPAKDTLPGIETDGPFDLVFIDADKVSYPHYLEWAAANLRSGGIVLGDNAFLFGKLPDEPAGESAESIRAMQRFHELLARSGKFTATVLPTGEGLAVGVKV